MTREQVCNDELQCTWTCSFGNDETCKPLTCFEQECDELSCRNTKDCGSGRVSVANSLDVNAAFGLGIRTDFEDNRYVNIDFNSSSSSSSSSSSDSEEEYGNNQDQRPVWGRIFQKKQAKKQSRRSRTSRYAQTQADPHAKKSDLEECMAL